MCTDVSKDFEKHSVYTHESVIYYYNLYIGIRPRDEWFFLKYNCGLPSVVYRHIIATRTIRGIKWWKD